MPELKKSNLHTHTFFCDGVGSPADYCAAAKAAGLVSLGFSAHAPLKKSTGFVTDWHLQSGDFDRYAAAVEDCKAQQPRTGGGLAIYLGLEVDYIDGFQSPCDFASGGDIVPYTNIDYLIGSVHCVLPPVPPSAPPPSGVHSAASPVPPQTADAFFGGGGKMLCIDGSLEEWRLLIEIFFHGDVYSLVDAYWNTMERMIDAGGFDILGHADLLKKNNRPSVTPAALLFDEHDSRYLHGMRRIAQKLAETGIVVEVNTGGISRGRTSETYPSLAFLRILHEHAVPITFGADAHKPEHICAAFETACQCARQAGYKEMLLFEGRLQNKPLWQPQQL
ncbi:MAG: histidinol-phosphatase [Spirochaetaceae bacterium]|nr:histidinol-phosphatase [Spirochaetaceae bacterium]